MSPGKKNRPVPKASGRRAAAPRPSRSNGLADRLADRLAGLALWILLLLPPLFVVPGSKEAFRFPKLLLSEWLGLASLLFLAWQIRQIPQVRWRALLDRPAVRLALPLLAAAFLGIFSTRHPLHFRETTIDLWIGAACLVGWSLGLALPRLARYLGALLIPGAILAFLGILQFHNLYRPFEFLGLFGDTRLAITSTAGNPGDLGSFLVLPCLAAQWAFARRLRERPLALGWRDALRGAGLLLCLYALALTQTIAAVAALAVGSLVLWGGLLSWRRRALALGVGAAVLLLAILAVPPLRVRTLEKVRQAASGDWNSVLTGRLDGWRAAVCMLAEHPWAGVGQGAYSAEFVPAKLALLDRGVPFYASQTQVVFSNAHNEFLETAADWGIPGIVALAWGLWVLGRALWRRSTPTEGTPAGSAGGATADDTFAWAGALALGTLALAHFPFRTALVAFPALLFLAWVLRRGDPAAGAEPPGAVAEAAPGPATPGRILAWPVLALLALALIFETGRLRDRLRGQLLLRQVELVLMAAIQQGQAPPQLLSQNLELLRLAGRDDPLEVGVPIARGSQYLVYGRLQAAIESYEAALALEPRPQTYLNLGRAQMSAGQVAEARKSFQIAVRLEPDLARVVPPGGR